MAQAGLHFWRRWSIFTIVRVWLLIQLSLLSSRGVILNGTGDPEANTVAPAGELTGSGWQYQGKWGGFLGTPVAPNFFLAARHVGGEIGQTFDFNGVSYQTVAVFDDPETDLRLWMVDGTFPFWAPLYLGGDEFGKPLTVFGRGTQRGEPVVVSCAQTNYTTNSVNLKQLGLSRKQVLAAFPEATFNGQWMTVITGTVTTNDYLRGWQNGIADGRQRWGTNQVVSAGGFLVAAFDGNGGGDEAFLSGGDSSGAVFIQEAGVWKLAGINYGVEGPFSTSLNDPYFFGAIFDKTGLFEQGMSTTYESIGKPRPICFYATRISPRLSWILSVIDP